jgi:hypothetical protein
MQKKNPNMEPLRKPTLKFLKLKRIFFEYPRVPPPEDRIIGSLIKLFITLFTR